MSPSIPDLGRFSGPAVGILASLAAGPRDSGAIAADLEAMTGSRVGPATLLGSLARLECHGLVAELETAAGPRRYRITELGAATLPVVIAPTSPVTRAVHVRLEEAFR